MKSNILFLSLVLSICAVSCFKQNQIHRRLAEFIPSNENPVFTGGGEDSWDQFIRERGWVMFEDSTYHLWYTGYAQKGGFKQLGYATSPDGIHWTRYPENPLIPESWVEDVCVLKVGDTYYMMSEGVHDWAHLLTSKDRIHWFDHGSLLIWDPDGTLIADPTKESSHAGTPVLFREDGTWYLFFERSDKAVWLAASTDSIPLIWIKVQKLPALSPGPDDYDNVAVAADCVVKINNRYYMYYHATAEYPWNNWCVCLAYSKDLIHWVKYKNNPIGYYGDAPVLVFNGKDYRFFVTDSGREMKLYYPAEGTRGDK